MNKPTKKQARKYLINKLIDDIRGKEKTLSDMKLVLNVLSSGSLDKEIEISDYKSKDWHLNLNTGKFNVSVWEFVSQTKKEEKEVDRFQKTKANKEGSQ